MHPRSDKQTLLYAKLLLRETQKSIRDITLRLLFASEELFIAYFRKHIGMTPQQYREKTKANMCNTGNERTQTLVVEMVFPSRIVREHMVWLSETYMSPAQDILSTTINHVDIRMLNGDIVRAKRFDLLPHKSAVVCRQFTGLVFYQQRRYTVNIHLDPQSNELTVSVDGLALFTKVSVSMTVVVQGPC